MPFCRYENHNDFFVFNFIVIFVRIKLPFFHSLNLICRIYSSVNKCVYNVRPKRNRFFFVSQFYDISAEKIFYSLLLLLHKFYELKMI